MKNHWVTKEDRQAAGYFDGSLEEKAKTEGDYVVKRLINSGMDGSSVTCVLIGAETSHRRWVHYEIFQSIESGMGVFGVYIDQLADQLRRTDVRGANPFDCLGCGTRRNSDRLWPMVNYMQGGWTDFVLCDGVSRSAAPYLPSYGGPVLSQLFRVYDWVANNGYQNFSAWVAAAVAQAGR